MENTVSKTYKFDHSLINTHLNPRYPVHKGAESYWIRLVEGESLKEKEQSEFAKPYRLFISHEFMTIDNYNEQQYLEGRKDYGTRIQEYDKASEYKKDREQFNSLVDIWIKVRQLEETERRGLGYRLFGKPALSMSSAELENNIQAFVNTNAELVNKYLEEKQDTDYAVIGLAMSMEVITEAKAGSEVWFAETSEVITTVRSGQKPIDAVAEIFKTNEGKELKRRIYQMLQPEIVEEVVEVKKTNATKNTTNATK